MKVLHVIDYLKMGGAERMFLNITTLLLDKNIHVEALIYGTGYALDSELDKRLKLRVLNRGNKLSIKKLYEAHKICSEFSIVHVHTRHCYNYMRLAQMMFAGRYKMILHDHSSEWEPNAGLRYIFRPKYYIGGGRKSKEWAINTLKIKEKNVFTLINTIIPRKNIQYRYNPSVKHAFIVSNIRPVKNIEFAIALFKKMDWALDIYGNTFPDEYCANFKKTIENEATIKLFEGVNDFSDRYNNYSLAVHCSKLETGPLVLLEYMAYGIPFIAYKVGGVAEMVMNDLPFLFVNSFDEEEWQQRIKAVQQMNDLPELLKEVFRKYFDPGKYVDQCTKVYQEINY